MVQQEPALTKTYSIEPYLDYVEATGIEATNSACMSYMEMRIEDDFSASGQSLQIIPLHAPDDSSTCLTGVDNSNASTAALDVPSY